MPEPPMNEDDRAELHRLRQEAQFRALVKVIAEQLLCQALGVQYQENGAHWGEFYARADINREMREDHARRKGDLAAVRKTFVEKAAGGAFWAILGLVGGGILFWLASKLGIKPI